MSLSFSRMCGICQYFIIWMKVNILNAPFWGVVVSDSHLSKYGIVN